MKDLTLIEWDQLNSRERSQWTTIFNEAKNCEFIGGEWFESAFLDPSSLNAKPVCIFLKSQIVGFFTPRLDPTASGKSYWRSGVVFILPAFRGRGIMRCVLYSFFCDHYPACAWIEETNESSKKLYLSLGFVASASISSVGPDAGPGRWYKLEHRPVCKKPVFLNW